jgi:hypothetical protein
MQATQCYDENAATHSCRTVSLPPRMSRNGGFERCRGCPLGRCFVSRAASIPTAGSPRPLSEKRHKTILALHEAVIAPMRQARLSSIEVPS